MENLRHLNVFNYIIPEITLHVPSALQLLTSNWKSVDIMNAVDDESWKFYGRLKNLPESDYFGRFYDIIKRHVKNIVIINTVTEPVIPFIKYIGLQLCEWLDFNRNVDGFDKTEFLNSLVYNYACVIDKCSSIDLWAKNGNETNGISIFRKICYFSLEDRIEEIWKSMSDEMKETLYAVKMNSAEGLFLNYWTYKLRENTLEFMREFQTYGLNNYSHWIIEGVTFEASNINWLMLRFSILAGNPYAVKYFSKILTDDEKHAHLMPCFRAVQSLEEDENVERDPKYVYMAQFLYDQMSPDQKTTCLQGKPTFFIDLFTNYWQYQDRAPNIIRLLSDWISDQFYTSVIQRITRSLVEGRYVREHLLQSIWTETVDDKRRGFFSFIVLDNECLEIFCEHSVNETNFILKHATIDEKNKILSYFEI